MSKTKKAVVHFRRWVKILIVLCFAIIIILATIMVAYKPTYAVSFNDEFVGYTDNKSELQQRINDYIIGKGENNIAFFEVGELPEYRALLVKRDVESNDDEIYDKVVATGQAYYHFFAIADDGEEKYYVGDYATAKSVLDTLREKDSTNIDDLTIVEKYQTTLNDFTDTDTIVENLYKKRVVVYYSSSEENSSAEVNTPLVDIGISFINPCSGILTSRYGYRWGRLHAGIDIGSDHGTPIYAAAAGTVVVSDWYYGYGYAVIIDHGNGVRTLYGHCSSLIAGEGEYVSQGQIIARVGSTGQSTGDHCHFEIRVDGSTQNPLNFVSY